MAQNGGTAQQVAPIGVLTEIARTGSLGSKAAVASEAYIGMLTCRDCGGVRVELSLYREGANASAAPIQVRPATYHLRETFYRNFNDNLVMDTNGTWREFVDERHPGVVVELLNRGQNERGQSDMRYLARAQKNEGTLVLLDGLFRELPADVPHMLVQVSGERQEHLTLLTEADNGRTVEMKPGEVFLMRLRNDPKTGKIWSSNRPRSMALVETGGPEGPQPAPMIGPVPSGQGSVSGITSGGPNRRGQNAPRQVMINIVENYSVWEMIAPSEGTQELRFEYRNPAKPLELPTRMVTVSLVVR